MRAYTTATRTLITLAVAGLALAGCATDDVTAPATRAPSFAKAPAGGAIAALVVAPPALTGVTLSPASLALNATGQGTVTLSGPVIANTTVTLTTSSSGVLVPPMVTIPVGMTYATFDVLALQTGSFTVTAALGAETRTASLTTY